MVSTVAVWEIYNDLEEKFAQAKDKEQKQTYIVLLK